jgi:hypothetical protein
LAETIYGVNGLSQAAWLDGNRIGDAGARALAASANLAELDYITLTDNQIGDPGAQALAASPHLSRLTTLALRRNPIGDAGARALAESRLPRLATLWMGDAPGPPRPLRAVLAVRARPDKGTRPPRHVA